MSGRAASKKTTQRKKPYDRPEPQAPSDQVHHLAEAKRAEPFDADYLVQRGNDVKGLRSFIGTLFWGKQTSPPADSMPVDDAETRDEADLAEAGHTGAGAYTEYEQHDRVPEAVPPPPPRSALPPRRPANQLLNGSTSMPRLNQLSDAYQPGSPVAGRTSTPRLARTEVPTVSPAYQPTSRGEALLRDVDQMAIPTAFTPQFPRTVSQSVLGGAQPLRALSNPFVLPSSRTMPSLPSTSSHGRDPDTGSVRSASAPTVRRQLYLGPGYSAQSIARRRREQGLLNKSRTLSSSSSGPAEPFFKRQRMSEAPLPPETPAVQAAIRQQPDYDFTFRASLPARLEPHSLPAPLPSLDASKGGPAGSSSPKSITRSADLIRTIFNEEKSEQAKKSSIADFSNPYQLMNSPIARVASIKARKPSVKVPREQLKKTSATMTPLQHLEATAPPEYRRFSAKRPRTADPDTEAPHPSLEVPLAAAQSQRVPSSADVSRAPSAHATSERHASPSGHLQITSDDRRSASRSPSLGAKSVTRTSTPAPAEDVEVVDLDGSDSEDEDSSYAVSNGKSPEPMPPPSFSFSTAPPQNPPFSQPLTAPLDSHPKTSPSHSSVRGMEAVSPFQQKSGSLTTSVAPVPILSRTPTTNDEGIGRKATNSAFGPQSKLPVVSSLASNGHLQSAEARARDAPIDSLPSFDLLPPGPFPPRVANADNEKAALALPEPDLPTFALLA